MDRLDALIASAHLRLRLDYLKRHPRLLDSDMTPKLKGVASAMAKLQHGLEARAEKLLNRIEAAEKRGTAADAKAHQTLDQVDGAMDDVEKFIGSLEGSNGGPTLADSEPEHLSVNGVTQG